MKRKIIFFVLITTILFIPFESAFAENFGYNNEYKKEGSFIFIDIGTNPGGATVKIDGEVVKDALFGKSASSDTTSCYVVENGMSIGVTHTISLELNGYQKWQKNIDTSNKQIATFFNTNSYDPDATTACSEKVKNSTIDYGIINLTKNTAIKPQGKVNHTCDGSIGLIDDPAVNAVKSLSAKVEVYENKVAKIALSWSPPKNTSSSDIKEYHILRSTADTNSAGLTNLSSIGGSTDTTFIDYIQATGIYNYQIDPIAKETVSNFYASPSNMLIIDLTKTDSCKVSSYAVHNVTSTSSEETSCPNTSLSSVFSPYFMMKVAICNLAVAIHGLYSWLNDLGNKYLQAVLGIKGLNTFSP